jgi:hypothetical protein
MGEVRFYMDFTKNYQKIGHFPVTMGAKLRLEKKRKRRRKKKGKFEWMQRILYRF